MVWSFFFWANVGLGLASVQTQVPIEATQPRTNQPNIVFILTDDQDLHLNSLDYMPLLQKHLVQQGTFYQRHFATVALCCPSRVSLWTGKTAHNTNVTDVNPPCEYIWQPRKCRSVLIIQDGGYPKFVSQGLNDNFLPVWFQEAGYNTYYTGKLFNAHTVENYHSPYVNGFTGSVCLSASY